MTMLGHTESFGKMARDEMTGAKDALFHRILYSLPHPLFNITYAEMTKTPNADVSIVNLLYAIQCIGKRNVQFIYDDEGDKTLGHYFEFYRGIVAKAHNIDQFIG